TSGQVRLPGEPEAVLPTAGPVEGADGYNPEQFLAMAWSTCLGQTLRAVLAEQGLDHPSHVSVEVGLHRDPAGGFRFAPARWSRSMACPPRRPGRSWRPPIAAARSRSC